MLPLVHDAGYPQYWVRTILSVRLRGSDDRGCSLNAREIVVWIHRIHVRIAQIHCANTPALFPYETVEMPATRRGNTGKNGLRTEIIENGDVDDAATPCA